jgi:hypothetical protein
VHDMVLYSYGHVRYKWNSRAHMTNLYNAAMCVVNVRNCLNPPTCITVAGSSVSPTI